MPKQVCISMGTISTADERQKPAKNDAIFSHFGDYRYQLWRLHITKQKDLVMFIGLNPSTGGKKNDPTLNILEKIVMKNGSYGGFYIGNLFAWVAPKPYEMKRSKKPIGDENDKHLIEMAGRCKTIICMWGNDGGLYGRDKDVVELLSKHFPDKTLDCFGTTKEYGNPIHPMFPRGKDCPYDIGKIEKFTLPK